MGKATRQLSLFTKPARHTHHSQLQTTVPFPTTASGALKLYEAKVKQIMEDQRNPSLFTHQSQLQTTIPLPTTATGALKLYEAKIKQIMEHQQVNDKPSSESDSTNNFEISGTTSTMMLARDRLLKINCKNADVFSIVADCFGKIEAEEFQDLEIAIIVQAAAEKVAHKDFLCAKKLLTLCDHLVFKTGSPVQRTVYYFAIALKERIDRETGFRFEEIIREKPDEPLDARQTQFSLEPAAIAHQQQFNVVAINHFTGMQCILDNVASAKRIHLIDFRIRNGWHWTIMMQALAVRLKVPVDLVKITAVGTNKEMMEKTGKRLSLFAESMEIPFSFHVIVSELKDLKEDMFKIEADETVAIFSSVCLFSFVAYPFLLDSLICVMKNLKPCVMIVNEVDHSTDSPNFNERFTKSLFYVGAMFDCASVCNAKDSYRKLAEEVHIFEVIQNIVVAEGRKRIFRHEKLSFWRALFMRFGFVETKISSTAVLQAKLMVDSSPGKDFYDMRMDGKSMSLGWKGIPFEFLSVWKLNQH